MTGMLDAALSYAVCDLPVLPLVRDQKIPLTRSGFYDATTDEAKIKEWWLRGPYSNVGLVVGEDSGVLVLDVDNKGSKNGSAELMRLEKRYGSIPLTYTVRTASGGLHYYFKFPDELRGKDLKKELALGLDLKYNGYVVAPPSVVNGVPYTVVNGSLSHFPDWPASMLEFCIKKSPRIDAAEIARRERGAAEGRSSICEKYGLTLSDVGLAVPSKARRTGEGYLIEHPMHGSTGGGNLYVNVTKNLWCCYRCDSGGDPLTWVAVREGFIDCSDAGPLDSETVKRCVDVLRSEGVIPSTTVTEPDGSEITIEVRGCDDIANAERFCSKYGETLRYCNELAKWLEFDGKHWRDVSNTAIKHRAGEVATIIRYEAAEAGRLTGNETKEEKREKERIADELNRWARTSSFKTRLDALVDRAKGFLEITALAFDRDPLLVNCDNGTYDIRTGQLRPHEAEDYLTHIAGPYIEGAKCEKWDSFLAKVQPSAEVRAFLQRATGYSATGLTNEEALFFPYGAPATGKSTFVEATRAALGSYGKGESFNTFLMRGDGGQSGPRPELLRLRGARLVRCIEVSEKTTWDSALLNTLISGEPYTARALYSNEPIEFIPEFKLWCAANHRPKVHYNPEEQDGFWRRLYPVPFDVEIPDAKQDKSLKDYFMKDPSAQTAILAWEFEGATEWYRLSEGGRKNGLQAPAAIIGARRDYEAAQSPVYEFIRNDCIVGYDESGEPYEVAVVDLWEVFSDARKGYDTKKVKSVRNLGQYLKGLGFERYRDTRDKSYHWKGLRLLKDGEEPNDARLHSWLNGSTKGQFLKSFYESVLHEGKAKNEANVEPLSHNSDAVKEQAETVSETTEIKQAEFDLFVLNALSALRSAPTAFEPEVLCDQTVQQYCADRNINGDRQTQLVLGRRFAEFVTNGEAAHLFLKLTGGKPLVLGGM